MGGVGIWPAKCASRNLKGEIYYYCRSVRQLRQNARIFVALRPLIL
jgi:hypothetical protein